MAAPRACEMKFRGSSVLEGEAVQVVHGLAERDHVGILLFHVEQIGFHDRRRAIRHSLAHHHAADVAHECIRHRRTNAAADTRPADQQRVDGKHTKKYLEVGAKEHARPPLADDAIAGSGATSGMIAAPLLPSIWTRPSAW